MENLTNSIETLLSSLFTLASDALEGNRTECRMATDNSKVDALAELLLIKVVPDKAKKTLSIIDNGIGITKADLRNILRVFASSRTKDIMEELEAWLDAGINDRYRVCFHWSYLVAEKVIVTTKHNDNEQYMWESQAGESFTVTRDVNGEQLGRGTKITLFLKEDQLEYLEERRIKDIVRDNFESIRFPTYIWTEKDIINTEEKELEPKNEGGGEIEEINEVVRISKKKIGEWQLITNHKPIWLKNITEPEKKKTFLTKPRIARWWKSTKSFIIPASIHAIYACMSNGGGSD